MNPEPWRLMLRTARVMKDRAKFSEEEWMQNSQSDRKTSVLKGRILFPFLPYLVPFQLFNFFFVI